MKKIIVKAFIAFGFTAMFCVRKMVLGGYVFKWLATHLENRGKSNISFWNANYI